MPGPESQSRSSAGRLRRPSGRMSGYDRENGQLTNLSKSVGRVETPPTADAVQDVERARQQAAIAVARGNALQPGPLSPLKRKANESEEEESDPEDAEDADDDDNPPLLDRRLDDWKYPADRIEWLYQAFERVGDPHDYRNDPQFQDEATLREVWKLRLIDCRIERRSVNPSGTVRRIQMGSTHVLEPSTQGHSSRAQLVRTDGKTLTLDGTRLDTLDREHGRAPALKLSRTDRSTIGLDAPTRPTQPPPTKPTTDKPPAPKRRAVVSKARVNALRKEQNSTAHNVAPGLPAKSASVCSKSAPKPARPAPPTHSLSDVEMADPESDEAEPAAPKAKKKARPVTPQTDNDHEREQQDEGVGNSGEDANEGDENAEPAGFGDLTKRQQAQLKAFTPEARALAKWVAERVRLRMVTTCPFPERIRPTPEADFYFDTWMVELWDEGHKELREGRPRVIMKDCHANFVRNQLSYTRNTLKKTCDTLVSVYFQLHRTKDGRAESERAHDLTDRGDENWTSPNEEDDDHCFQHPIIRDVIRNSFFRGSKSIGNRYIKEFIPFVPIPTIAYASSIIRHHIKAYKVQSTRATDLNSASNSDDFTMYMGMLEKHAKEGPGHLQHAQILITSDYLQSVPKPAPAPEPQMTHGPDRPINYSGLNVIKEYLGDAVGPVETWPGVAELIEKNKGKGNTSAAGTSG
ncbi:hypothetical protein FRC07_008120, partial [Ceratobasidium sp. 392]